MSTRNVEQLLETAQSLSREELLDAARRLIDRAQGKSSVSSIDVNTLAGSLTLDEDPMAIQERMRREWE